MLDDISKLMKDIEKKANQKSSLMIGIDGRSGSGKTMLANMIHDANENSIVFHMDDYRKPIKDRKSNWKSIPLENMDIDRMKTELILPAFEGKNLIYRNYDEKEDTYVDTFKVIPHHIYIIEGTYALCPELSAYYDIKVFMTCSPEMQEKRLKPVKKESYDSFLSIDAPLEEDYFYEYKIVRKARYYFDTTDAA